MNALQERTITMSLYQYYQGLLEEVYREFLDTYELDWGNIGIYFHEKTATCVVNAPQHLQLSLEFELYAFILDYPIEELEKLGREEKKAELQDALCGHFIDAYSQLDIESYFDEIWCDKFGEFNHCKPTQFLKVLQEDKAHFQKVYQEIIHER